MNFNNKKFYLLGLAVVLIGLFFFAGVSSASAAGCGKNQESFSFASFLNPLASLAEKVVKGFGYEVALASNPGDVFPGYCGSVTVDCLGGTATAAVSWVAGPAGFSYYILTVPFSSLGLYNVGGATSYTVPNLANDATYGWSVEAYNSGGYPTVNYGYTNQPYGSFTTPNCVLPPPPPPPTAPTGLSAFCPSPGNSATLSWNATVGAVLYGVQVDNLADSWNCGNPNDFCFNTSATSYTIPTIPGASYNWWMQSTGPLGWSPSSSFPFTCAPPPPVCPDTICNGAENCNTCPADCGACTLNVNFTANPPSGFLPLNVDLTADITGGTAAGSINYTFWWDCNNACDSVASCRLSSACGDPTDPAIGAKFDGVFDDPKIVNYTYSVVGTFTPKVIVERSTAPAVMKTATVTVSCNPTCSSWAVCDSACNGHQVCTDPASCQYNVLPGRDCNVPFYNLKNTGDIYVNIVKNSKADVTSTKTTISADLYNCFDDDIKLSETSNPTLPAKTKFNYAKKLESTNSYQTDLTITVPPTTPPGNYTITIDGNGGGYADSTVFTFRVNLKDPGFIEF